MDDDMSTDAPLTRGWTARGFTGLADLVFDPVEVPPPGPGEITVRITAAGVNPADLKHVTRESDPALLPIRIGYEVAGVVTATGSGTRFEAGDRVVAFRVRGGYAEALTVPVADAFALPDHVDDVSAAGLLLAGCTAADLLHCSGARAGETVVVHGASGAVGAAVLQLARRTGVVAVGTCGPDREEAVRRFGGHPVPYRPSSDDDPLDGPALADRIRAAAPGPVAAALDCAGTPAAVAASLELVADRTRIVTVAAPAAARAHGFTALAGSQPISAAYRDSVRAELVALLAAGELEVPIARTFPLDRAREALALTASGRAHGKVVVVP
ncbi:MAG: NADP-dependent oxidoreductase [Gordonia sp. (in: high G+C Gram-positive bacteria)]|uniref:NADP-dependent oxidoreductase n=1 Tax=Gordonia sp. (in: high G+C Gram-positive bacteria) TaxID=84139 RepID=UPI0039E49BD2